MNPACPRCGAGCSVKHGRFYRHDDAQSIQRYRCKGCGKCHSSATHTPTYRQKKRRLNRLIAIDIVFGTGQRDIARKHRCARKTVARKLTFLAEQARLKMTHWLAVQAPFEHVQFDELITFEHSRLKPLSVALMVAVGKRSIIGLDVAQIPASGLIARPSVKKYGKRADKSWRMRRSLLSALSKHLSPTVLIDSDEHTRYASEIKRACPHATHRQYPSVRGSLSGQGELKRTGSDPLFTINHTLAMLRDNIKRLARRNWCTTKRAEVLKDILAIYAYHHNTQLVTHPAKNQS